MKHIARFYPQNFLLGRSGVGPKNLHSYKFPGNIACCWSGEHTLRTGLDDLKQHSAWLPNEAEESC